MLPVYEPERDASGRIVYDDGVPRPQRIDGRIVGRVDPIKPLESLAFEPLSAEDYAGNRSTMTPLALPPQLLILDVGETENCVGCPKATAVAPQFKDEKHVYGLLPETRCLRFSLFATVDGQARFEYRPEDVDPPLPEDVWLKGPDFDARAGTVAWNALFDALTIEPGRTYRSRFILRSAAGETLSEEFWFGVPGFHPDCEEFDKYCNKYLKLCVKPWVERAPGPRSGPTSTSQWSASACESRALSRTEQSQATVSGICRSTRKAASSPTTSTDRSSASPGAGVLGAGGHGERQGLRRAGRREQMGGSSRKGAGGRPRLYGSRRQSARVRRMHGPALRESAPLYCEGVPARSFFR